ncbi:MAG: hypothetical protein ACREQI_00410 [Candidatus Binataceae bacterium]
MPTITGLNNVWWFNGAHPPGYPVQVTLTANPPGQSSYFWNLTNGSDFAQFSNGNSTMTTTANKVSIELNGQPSMSMKNISVTVTVNQVQSNPFMMTGKMPYELFVSAPPTDVSDWVSGYKSTLHYRLDDQFGTVLPMPLDVWEVFTTDVVEDTADNWIIGTNSGYSGHQSSPAQLSDIITGQNFIQFPKPGPQAPNAASPAWSQKVMHFCGYLTAGNHGEGKGVQIATLTWQRYINHGRHCDFVSPAGSFDPGNVPACPGANAAVCPNN